MYMYVFPRGKPFFLCNEHNRGKIKHRSLKYTIILICCVKKKSHFLERWSKHVPHWPHDMCFQAFCLEIICSDPQGVLQVFPIREFSTKNAEHFVFLSFKPQPFLSFHAS